MLKHKLSLHEIDNQYQNIAQEGRGSHRYYLEQHAKIARRTLLIILFAVFLAFFAVLVLSWTNGESYVQQWVDLVNTVFHHAPGKVDIDNVG